MLMMIVAVGKMMATMENVSDESDDRDCNNDNDKSSITTGGEKDANVDDNGYDAEGGDKGHLNIVLASLGLYLPFWASKMVWVGPDRKCD